MNNDQRRLQLTMAKKQPFFTRAKSAWNVFIGRERREQEVYKNIVGSGSTIPIHRTPISMGTEKSIVSAIYNRCAIDVAQLSIRHVRLNEDGLYVEDILSGLNRCITTSANIDQAGRVLIQDLVISMFDEGAVAVIPVDVKVTTGSKRSEILSLRAGKILEWFPSNVRVEVYNDRSGEREDLILPKDSIAIIENPLYSVMNEPNSTLKRLVSKLNLLDAIDEQSGSGKLDLIIQLPYTIKSAARQKLADERLTALEEQLTDSRHGIAYADGTEKIIQLNRPAENNLMGQIEYLTSMLYSQLGMSDAILAGTAGSEEYLHYHNRTVAPVASAITDELKRKFLSRTAIAQGQSVEHFRPPFSATTPVDMAELADKLTRNAILSSNEIRGVLGVRPSSQEGADELRNKNLNDPAPEENKEIDNVKKV